MSNKIPMTVFGHKQLKAELDRLKKVERYKIIEDIETARAHGDLSENAEYHAAKEAQSFNEGRIQELQGKLSNAEVIDPSKLSGERVVFGAIVTLFDITDDVEKTYQIVGDDEADIQAMKISFASPIARAIIGKEVGDEVKINTPGGTREVEIEAVRFPESC